MNPYFSRLAQRSGVASMPASSKPANAATDWSEQAVESTAPVNPLASNTTSRFNSTSIENKSLHEDEVGSPTVTMQSTNSSSNSISTQQDDKNSEQLGAFASPSLTTNTLSIGSDFVEQYRLQDSSPVETSVSLATPKALAENTKTLTSSAKHDSTIFNQPLASESSSFKTDIEANTHSGKVSSAQSETFEPTSAKVRSASSASKYSELPIEKTDIHDNPSSAYASPSIVPSKPRGEHNVQVEHVGSAPIQTPTLPLQTPRAASRSSIEVHIGKIELEIFSPTKKTAVTPAPMKAVTPRAASATAFNPHRHYLRAR